MSFLIAAPEAMTGLIGTTKGNGGNGGKGGALFVNDGPDGVT
jgi:hypothetical protein